MCYPIGLELTETNDFVSWYMGLDALFTSGVSAKIFYLIRDKQFTDPSTPFNRVRKSRILLFIALELIGFGATMAIVQTVASIGFPIIIALLVPMRTIVVPRMSFTSEELSILDGPTASPFVSFHFLLGQHITKGHLRRCTLLGVLYTEDASEKI